MEKIEWKIHFCWVKAHVGILGNELADILTKDAATNLDIAECYNKVPKSVVKRELEDRSVDKWQRDWYQSTKGKITKDYLPTVAESVKMEMTTTRNFTTMVTGHGNINVYLYRFKISETPTCPCGDTKQTTDHLLYECELLKTQRGTLRSIVPKSEGWPTSKHILISKYYKAFTRFTNQISFDNLHYSIIPRSYGQAITKYFTTKVNNVNNKL